MSNSFPTKIFTSYSLIMSDRPLHYKKIKSPLFCFSVDIMGLFYQINLLSASKLNTYNTLCSLMLFTLTILVIPFHNVFTLSSKPFDKVLLPPSPCHYVSKDSICKYHNGTEGNSFPPFRYDFYIYCP